MTISTDSHRSKTENKMDVFVSKDGIYYVISDDNKDVTVREELKLPIHSKTDLRLIEEFFETSGVEVESENVSIHVENSVYQLIPSELYRESDMPLLFNLVFGKSEDVFQTTVIPRWSLHLVYRVSETLTSFFNNLFPEAEVQHFIFSLLKTFIHRNEEAVYVNFRNEIVDIALVKDNKLQLFNSFESKTPDDACYHTLNVYEQFQLSVESFKLKIKKNQSINNKEIDLLKQYVSLVEVV